MAKTDSNARDTHQKLSGSTKRQVSGSQGEPARSSWFRRVWQKLGLLYDRLENRLTRHYWATYGIAVTRILLGFTGVGLLLTNWNSRHYTFGAGSAWNGEIEQPNSAFPEIWIFSSFHNAATTPLLFTLLYLVLGVLAVLVMLGWRTRLILPLYFILWVSFIETNDAVGDQGDNAYRLFLFAMLFSNTTLRWSLDARRRSKQKTTTAEVGRHDGWIPITAHNLAIVVLAFNVCAIYVAGGLYKAGGDPWAHGYAVYDPLQTAVYGTWPILSELVTAWGPGVVILTWGSMLFQIAFPFLLMINRYTRYIALAGILTFHAGIGLLMGLPWFSLTMVAVDAIFISDRGYRQARRYFMAAVHRMSARRSSSTSPISPT